MLVFIMVSQKLVQAMLSKTLKKINSTIIITSDTSPGEVTTTSEITGLDGNIHIYINYNSQLTVTLSIERNWENIFSGSKTGYNHFYFYGISLCKWDIIKAKLGVSGNASYSISFQNYVVLPNSKIVKVFELKNIRGKATLYLFGMLPDGTRWDGN